ncbi:MAG: hypothetical protein DWQ01_09925 [Planctomycetota bacterium]|nr:MAG: hypothetical protein DWQ01_09925 [Planctomycetota bacterium]
MKLLVQQACRDVFGHWALAGAVLWLLLAARLGAEAELGTGQLGDYLALVSWLGVFLLYRSADLVYRRRQQGWPMEDRLRDRRGWRLPLAEWLGPSLWWLALLLVALIPPWAPGFQPEPEAMSSHRFAAVHSRFSTEEVPAEGFPQVQLPQVQEWELDAGQPLPPGGLALLPFHWPTPPDQEGATLGLFQDQDGRQEAVAPGRLLSWPMGEKASASGRLQLQWRPHGVGEGTTAPQLQSPYARFRVPRLGRDSLPWLLLGQWLFFLPAFAFAQLLSRHLQVRAGFAFLLALALTSLAAWRPGPEVWLPDSPVAWVAQILLKLKAALPRIDGLLATGPDFHLVWARFDPLQLLAWLASGLLALVLSVRPWRQAP